MRKSTWVLLLASLVLCGLLAGCGEKPAVVAYYAPGEYMVVNIADSYRLLKASPVLVLNKALDDPSLDGTSKTLGDELKKIQPTIRDIFNTILRSRNEEAFKDPATKDVLRGEMTQALQEQLGMDYVTGIVFSDFVVQ